jgi:hypothetical protein
MEMQGKSEGEDNKIERGDGTVEVDGCTAVHCLQKDVPCLDLATTKDFLRFHIALSRGRIKNKTTVDSVKTFVEWFFAGFTRVTGTVINEDYRSAIYEVKPSSISVTLF